MNRRERVADFDARLDAEPEAVRALAELGRYLPVNPMADEPELLLRLKLEPASCRKVDLYWEYDADVRFVQVQTKEYATTRSPGMYARRAPSGYVNVVVVVDESTISSGVISEALRRVADAKLDENVLDENLRTV